MTLSKSIGIGFYETHRLDTLRMLSSANPDGCKEQQDFFLAFSVHDCNFHTFYKNITGGCETYAKTVVINLLSYFIWE